MQQLATLFAIALALTLPACGSNGSDPAANSSTSSEGIDSGAGTKGDEGGTMLAADAGGGNIGPAIQCGNPTDGDMLNAAPGSSVKFGGAATGPNGVASVTVNGAAATLSGTKFSANLTARFGINFASVVATDTQGAASTRLCSFLVADQWAPENTLYADTIDLKLTQGAIDEGSRSNGVHSFGDLIYGFVNGQGLAEAADFQFGLMNPVLSDACGQVCIPGVCIPPTPFTPGYCITPSSCVCAYSVAANFLGLNLPGPQSVSLTLVDGGIQAVVTVPSVGLDVDIFGSVLPGTIATVPFDLSGWVTANDVTVQMTFDLSLSNGQLQMSVRPNSLSMSIGSFSTEIPGLEGLVIDNVVAILDQLDGLVQAGLASFFESYLGGGISGPIGGILSGVILSTFGTSEVPNLASSGSPTPVSFKFGLTSLSTTSSEMLLGIASEFSAPAAQTLPSLGVAIPDGTVLDDATVSAPSSAGVAVHVGVLNQALHAAWRGGMFNTTVTGADFGNGLFPAAAKVQLAAELPPVANLVGNSVELSIGGFALEVSDPGVTGGTNAPPLAVTLGARLTSTPTLKGTSLKFDNAVVTELHFSTGDVTLAPTNDQALQSLLQSLVQQLAVESLNALPALPIPSFVIPSAPAANFPPLLGPTNLSLGYDTNDFVLTGQLGSP